MGCELQVMGKLLYLHGWTRVFCSCSICWRDWDSCIRKLILDVLASTEQVFGVKHLTRDPLSPTSLIFDVCACVSVCAFCMTCCWGARKSERKLDLAFPNSLLEPWSGVAVWIKPYLPCMNYSHVLTHVHRTHCIVHTMCTLYSLLTL